jgi:hypothetical protein
MGIIDRSNYTLTCKECNVSESASISDHGSTFGGSWWNASARFKNFDAAWEGGGRTEPTLVKATCKQCGRAPEVKQNYSM